MPWPSSHHVFSGNPQIELLKSALAGKFDFLTPEEINVLKPGVCFALTAEWFSFVANSPENEAAFYQTLVRIMHFNPIEGNNQQREQDKQFLKELLVLQKEQKNVQNGQTPPQSMRKLDLNLQYMSRAGVVFKKDGPWGALEFLLRGYFGYLNQYNFLQVHLSAELEEGHSIGVMYRDNFYAMYDPNSCEPSQKFSDLDQLVHAFDLAQIFSLFLSETIELGISFVFYEKGTAPQLLELIKTMRTFELKNEESLLLDQLEEALRQEEKCVCEIYEILTPVINRLFQTNQENGTNMEALRTFNESVGMRVSAYPLFFSGSSMELDSQAATSSNSNRPSLRLR